jgi:hypothetical protein
MVQKHHLELDNFKDPPPLVSFSPLTSVGGIPRSVTAEKIFNDPDPLWDTSLQQQLHASDLEIVWLAGEVEKLKTLSMDANEREVIPSMEQNSLILGGFPAHCYAVAQWHEES